MHAYRISTGQRLAAGDAISASRAGKWQRAYLVCVVDNNNVDGAFAGDLVIRFDGSNDAAVVRPHAAHDVMVRNR